MPKILTKTLIILLVTIILLNACSTCVCAAIEVNIDKAYIQTIGYADNHLKYYREHLGKYTYYTTIVAGYKDDKGIVNPVYCIDRLLPGADESPYYVTTENVLRNNKIWRIIKNGYPFKTAKEWGLTEEYNLYAATRFAIYCVLGQTKLEYFKADSDDLEGQAMLKTLKQLVEIGENGTETLQDDPLSTKKIGGFKENGDYYIQEYEVISTYDFKEYEIANISGAPDGTYISDKNGKQKNKFSTGENFFVKVPKSELIKNIDINIEISAECKVYIILEGKTTVEGTQNYVVTAGEYSTAKTNLNIKEKVNTGKIIVNKKDKDTGNPIEGVEFTLLNTKEKVISTVTTNNKGIAEFGELVQGIYTIVESKAHEKYIQSGEKIQVNVEYNKTVNLEVTNEHKKRKFTGV